MLYGSVLQNEHYHPAALNPSEHQPTDASFDNNT